MDIEQFRNPPRDPDAPIINTAIEDALALAPTEESRRMVIEATLRVALEYLARQVGRSAAIRHVESEVLWLRNAKPVQPWGE